MSAGNAPPNPGTPRKNPHSRPQPSVFVRRPGIIATASALGAVFLFYMSRPPAPRDKPLLSTRTPGVANIEKAYTNAGATPTHTKAYGGTPQGNKEFVDLRQNQPAGTGAPPHTESPMYREGVGDDQRPAGSKTKIGEMLDSTHYGTKGGK